MKIEMIVYALAAAYILAAGVAVFKMIRLSHKPKGRDFTLSVRFGPEKTAH
jgi:hypothetical protein